jgi:serine-type D-Ala-D-Ala endopeptidase (penicillin-binding protein 7)
MFEVSRLFLSVLLISGLYSGSVNAVERDESALTLASVSAAVARLGSDEPEFVKRGDWVMPIASITKLMTALVVVESEQDLDAWLPVVQRARPAPANAFSRIRLESEATRRDLLHLALMSSENRASYLLARHHPEGYEAFIEAMNAKARALGMTNTHFVDSTGLSDANVSTARDLIKLVNAAFEHPLIRELSISPGQWVQFRGPRYGLQYGNTNPLVRSSRWDVSLSKTGYLNAAGRCLVMVAEMGGEPHVLVLLDSLGTRTPLGDAGRIRRWLETGNGGNVAAAALNYERQRAAEREVAAQQSAGL